MRYSMKLLCNPLLVLVFLPLIVLTNQAHGNPVQLLTINEDKNTFSLNKKVLNDILLKDEIKDRTMVVVSIAGDFRQGKSFTLNFFLKYLEFTYKLRDRSTSSWMGKEDAPLRGFEWKTGQERVTSGIQMWSEVFCATLPDGEKVAIVLLDTQGLFDHQTPFAVNSKIFALSTLISSVQIFNHMQRIPEDKLHLLKLFTDYSSLAAKFPETAVAKPFQKLLFLVQNWPYPHENPYGSTGGRQLVERILKTADDQHPELKSVRERIKSCFDDVDGFLMPHPGSKVATSNKFDGRLSDIEEEYKKSLLELVPSLLASENLIPKKINGQRVKAIDLVNYLNLYVDKLNSEEVPTPKSFMDANAEISNRKALDAAGNDYLNNMKTLCDESEPYVMDSVLWRYHERWNESAFAVYENFPKFGDNHMKSYRTLLQETIDRHFQSCRRHNEGKKADEESERSQKNRENFSLHKVMATALTTGSVSSLVGGPVVGLIAGLGTLFAQLV